MLENELDIIDQVMKKKEVILLYNGRLSSMQRARGKTMKYSFFFLQKGILSTLKAAAGMYIERGTRSEKISFLRDLHLMRHLLSPHETKFGNYEYHCT